ncbi:MAG: hypothetical protein KAQ94_09150 [Arcobacteraceae bacterium]|nr:hypothetical protein [Arcobacteraceae bacterium]
MKRPLYNLFEALVKMNYKPTRKNYLLLNIEGYMQIKLSQNDIQKLNTRFQKHFIFSKDEIRFAK